jgi:hypothetical protein
MFTVSNKLLNGLQGHMKSNLKKKVFDALREEAVTNQSGNNEV